MFNPEAKWDDVKGNVLPAKTGVLGVKTPRVSLLL
jgi:hypothetical protein